MLSRRCTTMESVIFSDRRGIFIHNEYILYIDYLNEKMSKNAHDIVFYHGQIEWVLVE